MDKDIRNIQRLNEFLRFAEWIATPAPDREPKTQQELAEQLDVSKDTLVLWKKLDGFWAEVRKKRQEWVKDRVSSVLMGLYGKALKGDAQEVKLFLQYAGEFVEELKIKTEEEYSPETVKKVMETLKNEGFIITGNNTGQGEEKNSGKE